MIVSYRHFEQFEGTDHEFPQFIRSFILANSCRRIAEVGAGANPAIPQGFASAHGLEYLAVDVDPEELAKADLPDHVVFDLCRSESEIPGAPFDLIFSVATAEHFSDAELAYRNIFDSLVPGGFCVQAFPCLYALPFLVNRLLPHQASGLLLKLVSPRDSYRRPKFEAYYDRCRGPVRGQIEFLNRVGFKILEYRTYFGHGYYERRLKLLHALEHLKTRMLVRMPVPHLVSCATIILQRPSSPSRNQS